MLRPAGTPTPQATPSDQQSPGHPRFPWLYHPFFQVRLNVCYFILPPGLPVAAFWQRNYHERVIRDEGEFEAFRK